jgi:hypothetical protein
LPDELGELEWARRGWVEKRDGISGVTCDLCKATVEVIWDWERLRGKVLSERAAKEEEREKEKETEKEKEQVNGTNRTSDTNGTNSTSTPTTTQSSPTEDDLYSQCGDGTDSDLLLQHYKPLLSSGHTTKCPWSTRPADITVLRLPPPLLSISTLISRLNSLTPILSSFPPADRILTPKPLPISLPTSLADYDYRLLQAGITGWSGSLLGTRGLLTCTTCHRRVGLWLFMESGKENDLGLEDEPLDLIKEHKKYCPWINKDTQMMGMAGWEVLLSLLEPRKRKLQEEGEEKHGKESQLKRLREMLKGIRK